MSTAISTDTTVAGSVNAGDEVDFTVAIPSNAKYVLELGGTATVRVGIFEGSAAIGANGKLSVCGVSARGTRILNATGHYIRLQALSAGAYSIKLRPWSFTDYFTIGFYPSNC